MFPKKGNKFPGGDDLENGGAKYSTLIATALRSELGDTHRAAKTAMRWTGASERMVKHWLSGRHGPSGDHLLVLMRESEAVFETVLMAAGRRDAVVAVRMLGVQGTMVEVMAMVEREAASRPPSGVAGVRRLGKEAKSGADDLENDRINGRVNSTSEDGLNPRRRWYLEVLASGLDVRAADLQRRWGVSEKTARRDLAELKARGMIKFFGPFKTGRYRLNS